ncbi:MAG: hypothetical protein JWN70_5087 [Planctomycetaceae bacterium]|nr:hypothetical protein [Planctomycetaceae bacterium]
MYKKIAIIVAAVIVVPIVAILGYAATKSDTMRVERSTSIKAPPEKIFPMINDFHAWTAWSPWEKMDPALKRTYSGPSSGPGAGYAGAGNDQVGKGRMEITETSEPSKILIKLEFIEPFAGQMVTEYTLAAKGDSTEVKWAMQGSRPYIAKVMSCFIDCDKMIGKDFETGLANMKAVAEK